MEMEVRLVEADLQEDVKIGQGAVGSYEKAPPEHRVDPPNPDVDTVSFRAENRVPSSGQPKRLGSS